jgi:hypothetical protein
MGNASNQAFAKDTNQLYGTTAAVSAGTYAGVVDSSVLDTIFGSNSSASVSIYGDVCTSSSLSSCTVTTTIAENKVISAGEYWNIQYNPVYKTFAIQQVK